MFASRLSVRLNCYVDEHGVFPRHERGSCADYWEVVHSGGSHRCKMGPQQILHVVGVCGYCNPDTCKHDLWLSSGLQSWVKPRMGRRCEFTSRGNSASDRICSGFSLQLIIDREDLEGRQGSLSRAEGAVGCLVHRFGIGLHSDHCLDLQSFTG
eukprot:symbB.v1.2.009386.t1/scaffold595.1/size183375/8